MSGVLVKNADSWTLMKIPICRAGVEYGNLWYFYMIPNMELDKIMLKFKWKIK